MTTIPRDGGDDDDEDDDQETLTTPAPVELYMPGLLDTNVLKPSASKTALSDMPVQFSSSKANELCVKLGDVVTLIGRRRRARLARVVVVTATNASKKKKKKQTKSCCTQSTNMASNLRFCNDDPVKVAIRLTLWPSSPPRLHSSLSDRLNRDRTRPSATTAWVAAVVPYNSCENWSNCLSAFLPSGPRPACPPPRTFCCTDRRVSQKLVGQSSRRRIRRLLCHH